MDVNEDFIDIATSFVENGVDFLVVGAYALAAHGFPRTTGDIDLARVVPRPQMAGIDSSVCGALLLSARARFLKPNE